MLMKNVYGLFAVALMVIATACQSKTDLVESAPGSRVSADEMELFIKDLLSGVWSPLDCEVYNGEECVKELGVKEFGTIGAKFTDFGLGKKIVFYSDGTCRMGYVSNIYSDCYKTSYLDLKGEPKQGDELQEYEDHPTVLYDVWSWCYDVATATITITAEDLPLKTKSTTLKLLSYKGGEFVVEGALPNLSMDSYSSFKYVNKMLDADARAAFEKEYCFCEDDYPCCRQY